VTDTPTSTSTSTSTLTVTDTPTATLTSTQTYTATITPTFTSTSTITSTPTVTDTSTSTYTPTLTDTPTSTLTPTETYTWTNTPTYTATYTATSTWTNTYTPTITDTPTITLTATSTGTFTVTSTMTSTYSPTPISTVPSGLYQVIRIYDERGELSGEFKTTMPVSPDNSNSLQAGPQDVSGSLPIYLNDVLAVSWNGCDLNGSPVPQGVYHVVVELHDSHADVVTLAQNVVMMRSSTTGSLKLVAAPNHPRSGDSVNVSLLANGQPINASDTVQVFTLAGNRVGRVFLIQGHGHWETNGLYPGLYLLAWEGNDPANGSKVHKVVKVILQK
jgi:hypothetical protein